MDALRIIDRFEISSPRVSLDNSGSRTGIDCFDEAEKCCRRPIGHRFVTSYSIKLKFASSRHSCFYIPKLILDKAGAYEQGCFRCLLFEGPHFAVLKNKLRR